MYECRKMGRIRPHRVTNWNQRRGDEGDYINLYVATRCNPPQESCFGTELSCRPMLLSTKHCAL